MMIWPGEGKGELRIRLCKLFGRPLNLPIVAMTAHAMARDREQCFAAGMDFYITKPFQPEEIKAVLHKIASEQVSTPDAVVDAPAPVAKPPMTDDGESPIELDAIREHWRQQYQLEEESVETIVAQIRDSLLDSAESLQEVG